MLYYLRVSKHTRFLILLEVLLNILIKVLIKEDGNGGKKPGGAYI